MGDTPSSPVLTPSRRALVQRLQAEAAPVRRLWAPGARFGLWLALVALVGGVVGLSGVRPDLAQQPRQHGRFHRHYGKLEIERAALL